MEENSQKSYLTGYNLLITQSLWYDHYQILLIIWLKEFIKLNEDMEMVIKNMKIMQTNTN